MLDASDLVCDDQSCEQSLTPEEFRLSFVSGDTRRRVYECHCGAVTITIGRVTVEH